MFQHRRFTFLLLFVLVFAQTIYYFLTIHVKSTPLTFTLPPWVPFNDLSTTTELPIPTDHFPGASFSLLTRLAQPNEKIYQTFPICSSLNTTVSVKNDTRWYHVTINQNVLPYVSIEQEHGSDLYPGGHWFPRTCRSEQRVAIVVCYRFRELHLKLFLNNIHRFLQQQQIDYTIFIVNQHGQDQFNRAALFNVGFLEARKLYSFDCFIFHDVDLLPEDLRNIYQCGDRPRHMSVAVDKFNYRLLYATLFGGVTAFHLSDFLDANGYPTIYWGWGGEDDDMYLRVEKKLRKKITRYPIDIARYKMIRSMNHTSGRVNPHRYSLLRSKYNYNHDGINTLKYQINRIVLYQLFTLINVTLYEESYDDIRRRLNISKPLEKTKKIH